MHPTNTNPKTANNTIKLKKSLRPKDFLCYENYDDYEEYCDRICLQCNPTKNINIASKKREEIENLPQK
jgi:hypothetical protein